MNSKKYVLMVSIDEGKTRPKINEYAFTIASLAAGGNGAWFLFNDPLSEDIKDRPLFKLLKELLSDFRAYIDQVKLVSKLTEKDLKERFDNFGSFMRIFALEKDSKVSKEEKKLYQGKRPDWDGAHFVKTEDKLASICDMFITVKDAGNIDDKAIFITSKKKIGENIKKLLKKHCSEFKRIDKGSIGELFDYKAARKALELISK